MMRLGCNAEGLGRDHWNEMLAYPRKPIAHWHPLLESKKSEKEVGSGLKSFFFFKGVFCTCSEATKILHEAKERGACRELLRLPALSTADKHLEEGIKVAHQKSDSITESNLNTQTVQKSHV